MRLTVLGGLNIEGLPFRREKPLLLLAHIALEDSKPRRTLAELFWPEAADPMNSLSVALTKLRRLGVADADEHKVWLRIECDAAQMQTLLRSRRLSEGVALYKGAFADGIDFSDLNPDLEEWVYATREALAQQARLALLALAEQTAAAGNFADSGELAARAYRLPGAVPCEPDLLRRLYRLLLAADHPLKGGLGSEATDLEVALPKSQEAARSRLRQTLLGRDRELERLVGLEAGQWGWVSGGSGMGKTALLRELENRAEFRYLPARAGLPYATLEPLFPTLPQSDEAILRQLAKHSENLIFDDWEAIDPESQQVLSRLRSLAPGFAVVLTGQDSPPFRVDVRLELGRLTPADLTAHPGAFEATAGLPSLVGAWLRGEPADIALQDRLGDLSQTAKEVYAALTLLEAPDLLLVRQALGLDAALFSQALEALEEAGLIGLDGKVWVRGLALEYLASERMLEARLSLALARLLKPPASLPLYRRARALVAEADQPQMRKAYLAWGQELIDRGFPKRAADDLAEAPRHPETDLLRARALERAGFYKETITLLEDQPETPEVLALRASVWFNFGESEAALQAATKALKGGPGSRAEAYNVLGKLELYKGQFDEAEQLFKRSAALWLGEGNHSRYVDTLTNQAIARSLKGEFATNAFADALKAAGNDLPAKALVLLNLAEGFSWKDEFEQAIYYALQARDIALECGRTDLVAAVWSNLGSYYEHSEQRDEARAAYNTGLAMAREAGSRRLIGLNIWFLGFIDRDEAMMDEALRYLEEAGYLSLAKRQRKYYETFRERSGEVLNP